MAVVSVYSCLAPKERSFAIVEEIVQYFRCAPFRILRVLSESAHDHVTPFPEHGKIRRGPQEHGSEFRSACLRKRVHRKGADHLA